MIDIIRIKNPETHSEEMKKRCAAYSERIGSSSGRQTARENRDGRQAKKHRPHGV